MHWTAFILIAWGVQAASSDSPAKSNPAATESRLAVLGFGQCQDPLLAPAVRALRDDLSQLGGVRVLSEEDTSAMGGLPGASLDEVRRAIESGRNDFLNLNAPRAEQTLRAVLPEIDRLPIGPQRWDAYWNARANLARVMQYQEKRDRASEQFLEILKVQDSFTLSNYEYPPSARQLLADTKSLLQNYPRFELKVTTREPGATVYANGYALGRTPFSKRMIAGRTYQVAVGDDQRVSFNRSITLVADTGIEIDLEKESKLRPGGPCYQTDGDRDQRLAAATLLAGVLGVDQVVAVRLEKLGGGDDYVAAALVQVTKGREVREGRVRAEGGVLPPMDKLSQFVLTGEGPRELSAPIAEKKNAKRSKEKLAAPAEAVAAPSAEPAAPGNSGRRWMKPAGWACAALALGLAGGAIYEHWSVGDQQAQMQALVLPGTGGSVLPENAGKVKGLRAGIDSASLLRYVLGGGAVVAGAGAGVLLYLGRSTGPGGEAVPTIEMSGDF